MTCRYVPWRSSIKLPIEELAAGTSYWRIEDQLGESEVNMRTTRVTLEKVTVEGSLFKHRHVEDVSGSPFLLVL